MDNMAEKKEMQHEYKGEIPQAKDCQMLEYILRGEASLESFKTGLDKPLEKILQQIYRESYE